MHELIRVGIHDTLWDSSDAGVGKKDVKATVYLEAFVNHTLHIGFLTRIHFPRMDFDTGIQRGEFTLVGLQMICVVVGDEDGLCAVVGEEMC